jgi:dTDP-4-dehydrorhamnose 3,5-epimerase
MRFTRLSIVGVWCVEVERMTDERGHFARAWCQDEFAAHGIDMTMVQASFSFNHRRGTLRGMHFAWPPSREGKLVRCTRGQVHDVLLDLRPGASSFLKHIAVVLDEQDQNAVYIPPGVAHGFQSLVDNSELLYMMTDRYAAHLADGVRYDDTAFGIAWPLPVSVIADRDRNYADFDLGAHVSRFGSHCGESESAR